MVAQPQKTKIQFSTFWWHSGMLMILVSSFIISTSSSGAHTTNNYELTKLITIKAYNISAEPGNEDFVLENPEAFILHDTNSNLYLPDSKTPLNLALLLQCKETFPHIFFIGSYSWSIDGKLLPEETASTLMTDYSKLNESGVTKFECHATRRSAGFNPKNTVVISYFQIIHRIKDDENPSEAEDEGGETPNPMANLEEKVNKMSLLFKSQNDDVKTISKVKGVNEGQSLTLSCELTSVDDYIPHIGKVLFKFFKNDMPLVSHGDEGNSAYLITKDSETKSSLVIELPSKEDNGVFSCVAESTHPELYFSIYSNLLVVVNQNPKITDFPEASELTINAGSSLTLNCSIESNSNATNIYWAVNGTAISCDKSDQNEDCGVVSMVGDDLPNKRTSQLTVQNLLSSGRYSCIANNTAGTVERSIQVLCHSESPKINSRFPHKIVMLWGSDLNITCTSSGIPAPDVAWSSTHNTLQGPSLKDGMRSSTHDGREYVHADLIILNLEEGQQGSFQCAAENVYNEVDKRSVTIIGVKASKLPADAIKHTHLDVNAGEELILDCNATIDSRLDDVKRSWFKDSELLPEHEDEILFNLPYVTANDHHGRYECVVETAVDTVTKDWTINVISQSPTLQAPKSKVITVMAGGDVTMPCELQKGLPKPQLLWKKGKQSLDHHTDANVLHLTKVSVEEHEGTYTCRATNTAGSQTHSAELLVNGNLYQQEVL